MQLFINLLVVQYGSSQSVSYSKRGQACILEIALKNDGGKKSLLKPLRNERSIACNDVKTD